MYRVPEVPMPNDVKRTEDAEDRLTPIDGVIARQKLQDLLLETGRVSVEVSAERVSRANCEIACVTRLSQMNARQDAFGQALAQLLQDNTDREKRDYESEAKSAEKMAASRRKDIRAWAAAAAVVLGAMGIGGRAVGGVVDEAKAAVREQGKEAVRQERLTLSTELKQDAVMAIADRAAQAAIERYQAEQKKRQDQEDALASMRSAQK